MRTAFAAAELAGLIALCGLVAAPARAQDEAAPDEGVEAPVEEAAPETPEPATPATPEELDEVEEPEAVEQPEPVEEEPTDDADALGSPAEPAPHEPGTSPPEWPPGEVERAAPPIDDEVPGQSPSEPPEELHALPIRAALRPLTLTQGTGTIQLGWLSRFDPIVTYFPTGSDVGVTDDIQIGLRYPIPLEPEIHATARFFHEEWIELGARGFVRIPMFWQGDTVVAAEALVLIRAGDVLRVVASGGVDLLLTDPVSPLGFASLEAELSLFTHFFVGARGWIGSDDGLLAGSAGGYLGWTVASPRVPIMDVRFGVELSPQLRSEGITIYLTHTFYPRWFG